MDERARFIRDWERDDLSFVELCDHYGISRTIGYKWLSRYEAEGVEGLKDRSRRPHTSPTRTSAEIVERILDIRRKHPTWGGRKIVSFLARRGTSLLPGASTVDDLLRRQGLTRTRSHRRRPGHPGKPVTTAQTANELWTADFKGEFRLRSGPYCYPLTVADQFSRYLLACTARPSTAHEGAQEVFDRVFREYGLPDAIRTDNGVPFASAGLARLSRLSVWWIKLGIHPELIEPGSPQQNGAHERMHRTLKAEATRPPAASFAAQQRRFNTFRAIFNDERPHEALGQRMPADLYTPSWRPYPAGLPPIEYPAHFEVRYVSRNNGIRWKRYWVNVSSVLAEEYVGLEEIDDGIWALYFADYLLARLNERTRCLEELATGASRRLQQ
jgi:transposase InsO family protein